MSLSKPRGTPMEGAKLFQEEERDIINVAAVTRQEMMDDFDSFNVAEKTARYLRLGVNTVRVNMCRWTIFCWQSGPQKSISKEVNRP
uniref:Uncharacterized protein n=1 Tax=Timema shepardi TaxID=629360 RepID=A0A7R9G6T3_TIMSH|nr:unnamed protein product [Timema shepardi]